MVIVSKWICSRLLRLFLFYGLRLMAVQHILGANCPNSPLAHVLRFNEQLMGPLQGRCSNLTRDSKNKNMAISGLTLVGESDAMSRPPGNYSRLFGL